LFLGTAIAFLLGLAITTTANVSIFRQGTIYGIAEEAPAREWAIVLGARVRKDGTLSLALEDRLTTALEAYRIGRVRRILVSADGRKDEARAMATWLEGQGVLPDCIMQDDRGLRTRATMENAFHGFGVVDAIVCTQRFHLPRALAWARHEGIDAVGLEADRHAYPHQVYDELREAMARTVAWLEITTDSLRSRL